MISTHTYYKIIQYTERNKENGRIEGRCTIVVYI